MIGGESILRVKFNEIEAKIPYPFVAMFWHSWSNSEKRVYVHLFLVLF